MDYQRELEKQYEELGRSGYFFFIPERSLFNLSELLLNDDSILLFQPVIFKKAYFELFKDECSVAGDSVDADGCLGQE